MLQVCHFIKVFVLCTFVKLKKINGNYDIVILVLLLNKEV